MEVLAKRDRLDSQKDLISDLVVRILKSEKQCLIRDFYRARQSNVFLSNNERFLAYGNLGASSESFHVYDLNTCQQASMVDGWLPRLEDERVYLIGGCEGLDDRISYCCPASVYRIDSSCKLHYLKAESKVYTKKVYGVAISKCEYLENEGTPKARIVKYE